ncbi:uncharacterized protein LOC123557984 [Mercenaria mercenaria]|uniref:uncharacterized protein LOC123557984 n=1 Tax=Mercenaria mercenaria TaxID=6596 RepID=UPI00234F8DA9|nr:uncharacterized protein LOC123557984 [Mercenaria mercenaria]XP_045205765.2 uncharacterized protein LOC123557984 [Mercenaria mercenaria]
MLKMKAEKRQRLNNTKLHTVKCRKKALEKCVALHADEANTVKPLSPEQMVCQDETESNSEEFNYAAEMQIPTSVKCDIKTEVNQDELSKTETDFKYDINDSRVSKSSVVKIENQDGEIFDSFIIDYENDSEPLKQTTANIELVPKSIEEQTEHGENLGPVHCIKEVPINIVVKVEPIENEDLPAENPETLEQSEPEDFITKLKETREIKQGNTTCKSFSRLSSSQVKDKEVAEPKGRDVFTSLGAQEQLTENDQASQNKDVISEKGNVRPCCTGLFFHGGFSQKLTGTQSFNAEANDMDRPMITVPQISVSVPLTHDNNNDITQTEAEVIKEMLRSARVQELMNSPGKPSEEIFTNKEKGEKEKYFIRNRERRPDTWQSNIRKTLKTMGKAYVSARGKLVPAKHLQPIDCTKCKQRCTEKILEETRKVIFEWFWKLGSYTAQKEFVLSRVKQVATKTNKLRQVHRLFSFEINGKCVSVCKKFFTRTLGISGSYIRKAFEQKAQNVFVQDGRGKSVPSNKTSEEQIDSVHNHLDIYLEKYAFDKSQQNSISAVKWYDEYKTVCCEENKKPVSIHMYRRIFKDYVRKYPTTAQMRSIEISRGNENKVMSDGEGDFSHDIAYKRINLPAQAEICERVNTQDEKFVQGIVTTGGNRSEAFEPNTLQHETFSQYDARSHSKSKDERLQELFGTESFPKLPLLQVTEAKGNNTGMPVITVPQTSMSVFPTDSLHEDNNGIMQTETDTEMLNKSSDQEIINLPGQSSKDLLKNNEKNENEIELLTRRKGRPETWKRNIRKRLRTTGQAYINTKGKLVPAKYLQPVDCTKCKQRCTENISEDTRKIIFEAFWKLGSYTAQKEFVLSRVKQVATKTNTLRKVHRLFSFEVNGKCVFVCKTFFTRTLGISGGYICNAFIQKARDVIVKDRRGGVPRNKISGERIDSVHKHLDIYLANYFMNNNLQKRIKMVKLYDEYVVLCREEDKTPVSKHMYSKIYKEYMWRYPRSAQEWFVEIARRNEKVDVLDEKKNSSFGSAQKNGSYVPAQAETCKRRITQDKTCVQGSMTWGEYQNQTSHPNTLLDGTCSQYDAGTHFHTHSIFQAECSPGFLGTERSSQPTVTQAVDATANNMDNPVITLPQTSLSVLPTDTSYDSDIAITQSEADAEILNKTPFPVVIKTAKKEKFGNKEKRENKTESVKRGREGRPVTWKKNVRKTLRTEGKAYINAKGKFVSAKHLQPVDCSKCKQRCSEKISEETRKIIFESFWKLGSYTAQKEFVLSRVKQVATKTNKLRQVHRLFSFEVNSKYVCVCKTFFTKTLGISGSYICTAFEQKARDMIVQDRRGKGVPSNKTSEEQIASVHKHLDIYLAKYPMCMNFRKRINLVILYDEYIIMCREEDKTPVSNHMYRKIFKDYTEKYPIGAQERYIAVKRRNENKDVLDEKKDLSPDTAHERGCYLTAQAGTCETLIAQDETFGPGIITQNGKPIQTFQPETLQHGTFNQSARSYFSAHSNFQDRCSEGLPVTERLSQPTLMQDKDETANNMCYQMMTVTQTSISVLPTDASNDININTTKSEDNAELLNNTHSQEMINTSGKSGKEKLKNREKSENESVKRVKGRPENWKKNVRKKLRSEGQAYMNTKGKVVSARHLQPVDCTKCKQRCTEKISEETRMLIFEAFWKLGSYTAQKEFVLSQVKQVATKTSKLRQVHRLFSFEIDGKHVSVCKTFFIRTLCISSSYICTAFAQKARNSTVQDMRGKGVPSNKTPEEKIDTVHKHLDIYLANFPNHTPLPKSVKTAKMYTDYLRMCSEENKTHVSKQMYRTLFQDYARKYHTPGETEADSVNKRMSSSGVALCTN